MDDFSLVPVEHQPDFADVSLVPVDHDPFGADGVTQQGQAQQVQQTPTQVQPAPAQPQSLPQQPATGAGAALPNVGAPAANSQAVAQQAHAQTQQAPAPNDPEDAAAMSPETYVNPFVKRLLGNLGTSAVTLPQRAIDAARVSFEHNYGPGPSTMSDSDVWVDPLPAVTTETAIMTLGGVGAPRFAGMGTKGVARRAGLDRASGPIDAAEAGAIRVSAPVPDQTLYHYTNEAGLNGILSEGRLNPSLKATNPNDVRYGNGQYLSDIPPGTMTPDELSISFLRVPWQGRRFTHYLEIDPGGLNVLRGRPGVYVIPNEAPLNLSGRVIGSGRVPRK